MQHVPQRNESESLSNARKSLLLMTERGIDPNPINYSVWYHYVACDIGGLNEEIEQFLKNSKLPITDDVNIYLYNKYVMESLHKEEAAIKSATDDTQNVLGEIMSVIEKFSGDTESYNNQIDSHVTNLSNKILDPALKEMAKEIINQAVSIRDSGKDLQLKLEESKKEVNLLKNNLEKITLEANKDFLTGVGNRKAFEQKIDELTKWAVDNNGDLCLLMIDIDHFKKFNDKYGHQIGDEVLKKVGRTIFDTIKGKDFVSRYGGEEFAVLLPNTPLANALIVAENIRRNMHDTRLQRKDTKEFIDEITVSIGVARYRPEHDSSVVLIGRADDALYRSKKGGRNCVNIESF